MFSLLPNLLLPGGLPLVSLSHPNDGVVDRVKLALLLGSLGAPRERFPGGVGD
jgi:hypothetical protein